MPQKRSRPSSDLLPRWRRGERGEDGRRPQRLDEGFDSEISPAVQAFIDKVEAEGGPVPDPGQVVDRIRHVLRHSKGREGIRMVHQSTPPYFGVTTYRADAVVEDGSEE